MTSGDTTTSVDVAIAGDGIIGLLCATFIKLKCPDLRVVVIGNGRGNSPLVGESTVEATDQFLREIGLKDVLERDHATKYGLTFYLKDRIDDPEDRTYAVVAKERFNGFTAAQLNRHVFDGQLLKHAVACGVEVLPGTVSDVMVQRHNHRAMVETESGEREIRARWIIDATGRRRLLARKLGLTYKLPASEQRSCFWFRLKNFDQSLWLRGMRPVHNVQFQYEPWLCTHHFMGRGKWAWCIPLKSENGEPLVSVGLTWHPEHFPHEVTDVEQFLEHVEKEHPMLSEFVRSGEVVDTALYRNYIYRSSRFFSPDGWFLVGDAAHSIDPLYSFGLALSTLHIRQITDIVQRELAGNLPDDHVDNLDAIARVGLEGSQHFVNDHYRVSHDPFQIHLMVHSNNNTYFRGYLPMLAHGVLWNPDEVRALLRSGTFEDALKSSEDLVALLAAAAKRNQRGARSVARLHQLAGVNSFQREVKRTNLRKLMSEAFLFRVGLRAFVWHKAGHPDPVYHSRAMMADLVKSTAFALAGRKAIMLAPAKSGGHAALGKANGMINEPHGKMEVPGDSRHSERLSGHAGEHGFRQQADSSAVG